jgi:alpha-tubulin suppressor-like RCC1 family protein
VVSYGFLGQATFFLAESGELYCSGNNEYGQLGLGTTAHQNVPQKFVPPGNQQVISLSAGTRHTAIVTVEGKLYCFGHNDKLQLGGHSQEKVATPMYVQHQARFIAVSCGNNHSLALSDTLEVYSFGSNEVGQLGVSRATAGLNRVPIPEKVVSIVCGHDHSAALGVSGKLYVWGCGSSGQLGLSHSANVALPEEFTGIPDRIVKVICGYMHTAVLNEKGELYVFGFIHNDLKFGNDGKLVKTFPPNDRVVQLASGSTHILALTANGNLYGYGVNGHGQLGIDGRLITQFTDVTPFRGKKITLIAAGFQHSVVLTGGQAFAFGRNERGQLGIGHSKAQPTPAQVNIPNVRRVIDLFNLTQHAPLIDASMVSEELEQNISLPLPTNYHPDYALQFQQQSQNTHEETSLPLPQSFSIVGNRK